MLGVDHDNSDKIILLSTPFSTIPMLGKNCCFNVIVFFVGNKRCCIVLYCIVLYCIVLYCIVLYCIVLYCIVLYCIVLYCIVLYCIVLYCIVLYCILGKPFRSAAVRIASSVSASVRVNDRCQGFRNFIIFMCITRLHMC